LYYSSHKNATYANSKKGSFQTSKATGPKYDGKHLFLRKQGE